MGEIDKLQMRTAQNRMRGQVGDGPTHPEIQNFLSREVRPDFASALSELVDAFRCEAGAVDDDMAVALCAEAAKIRSIQP